MRLAVVGLKDILSLGWSHRFGELFFFLHKTMTSHSNDNFERQVFCKIQGASRLCAHKNLVSP